MKKNLKKIIISLFIVFAIFKVADFALAQTALTKDTMFGGNATGGASGINDDLGGLTESDPRTIVARIINVLFGFLGIVALVIVMYGGWLWMSSNGEEQKITKAKQLLKNGAIGLAIILSAFAIVSFLLGIFFGDGEGGPTGTTCIDGQTAACGGCGTMFCTGGTWSGCVDPCSGIPGSNLFYVTSNFPVDNQTDVIKNAVVTVMLNKAILDGASGIGAGDFTVEKVATINPDDGSETPASGSVSGDIAVLGADNVITFTPDGTCSPALPDNLCFEEWTKYKISLQNLESVDFLTLLPYSFEFSTSDKVDVSEPTTGIIPTQICYDDGSILPEANTVTGWATDDTGIQSYMFYQQQTAGPLLNVFGDVGNFGGSLSTSYDYDTTSMTPGDVYDFGINFVDFSGKSSSAEFTTTIKPGHCCNGILDFGEEEVDCGGECMACAGGACNLTEPNTCSADGSNCSDSLCVTWFCGCEPTDECICQEKPIISWISPVGGFCNDDINVPCALDTDCPSGTCNNSEPNGAPGNLVTIGGAYFGDIPGEVRFSDGTGGWTAPAQLANDINPDCDIDSVWQDNQIIVAVPSGAKMGPVQVVANSGYDDTTADVRGPVIDFVVNSIQRPGLCKLDPTSGKLNDEVSYFGVNLAGANVHFGNLFSNVEALNPQIVSDMSGTANVPNILAGITTSFVFKNISGIDLASNFLNFEKEADPVPGPVIISFDPITGNSGQYVTIYGSGFGEARVNSQVWFTYEEIGDDINFATSWEANYDFPDVCADSVWSDNQVIVKVPEGLDDGGNYYIRMIINPGEMEADTSNIVLSADPPTSPRFNFDAGADLLPSLCKLDPLIGPNNSNITLYGEYFGNTPPGYVKFFSDKNQNDFSEWINSVDFDRIKTTVPAEAISGPVKVVQSEEGNGLNFQVGFCYDAPEPDVACGGVCCPAGSFREGFCASDEADQGGNGDGLVDINDCYLQSTSSVFEFSFVTEDKIFECEGDAEACGNFCCANGCSDAGTECEFCPGQNECGDGTCCNVACIDVDGINTCPPSCSGFDFAKCLNNLCPNAPGQCSGNEEPLVSGSCDCSEECGVGVCQYNDPDDPITGYENLTNRCLDADLDICDMSHSVTRTIKIDLITQEYTYFLYCKKYNDQNLWHLNSATCPPNDVDFFGSPSNWKNLGNGVCVDLNNTCGLCENNLSCIDDENGDYSGVCGTSFAICPGGFDCNAGECQQVDAGTCECCCSISNNNANGNPACCSPLICDGQCGAGGDFGVCSGCADTDDPDGACNCAGVSGKFCDTNADPDGNGTPEGACVDCTTLFNEADCSAHSDVCCYDGLNGICRGNNGEEAIDISGNPFTGLGTAYCAYYECNETNACLDPVVTSIDPVFVNETACLLGCGSVTDPDGSTSCMGAGSGECAANTCPNSPGICSGGEITSIASCGDDYCNSIYSYCEPDQCSYSATYERCIADAPLQQSCSIYEGGTLPSDPDMTNVSSVECVKDSFTGGSYWKTSKFGPWCPNSDWRMDPTGNCVLIDDADNVMTCNLCDENFNCDATGSNDNIGTCFAGNQICPDGSTCDGSTCVYDEPVDACECCCRKDNPAVAESTSEDCCGYINESDVYVPLMCGGECGDEADQSIGLCTGCLNAPDPDDACNCDGSFGKFCYDDGASGVCMDCSALATSGAEECSLHADYCCVDAMGGNVCREGAGNFDLITDDAPNLAYCSYYECVAPGDADPCQASASPVGVASKELDVCIDACQPDPAGAEAECVNEATETCENVCSPEYTCFDNDGLPLIEPSCGYCCCEIGGDTCELLGTGMFCNYTSTGNCADDVPGDGNDFGICCGCSTNSACGNIEISGCGYDTCCHGRPSVVAESPTSGDSDVCRNVKISVDFDEIMDVGSLGDNILLVGEYDTICPANTTFLTKAEKIEKNIFVRAYRNVTRIFKKTLFALLGKKALADLPDSDLYNYCAVSGSISTETVAAGGTRATFIPTSLLDAGVEYYAIVKGDDDLQNNFGVKNLQGVGMNGAGYNGTEGINIKFNEKVFANSHIWSFTTMSESNEFDGNLDGACKIDHVEINPKNYLFSTNVDDITDNTGDAYDSIADSDKLYTAEALANNGDALIEIPGIYEWSWSWDGSFNSIVDVIDSSIDNKRLLRVKATVQDGMADIRAIANDGEDIFEDSTSINVFVCNNPWPAPSATGEWKPWTDWDGNCDGGGACNNTDFLMYYCRDYLTGATTDDLPALVKDAIINGEQGEIYKEFYFFQEDEIDGSSTINGDSLPNGGGVDLAWSIISGVDAYRLYYSDTDTSFSDYVSVTTNSVEIGEGTAFPDVVFEDNKTYYFVVTGYVFDTGAETEFSDVFSVLVQDTQAPTPKPVIDSIVRDSGTATINWTNSSTETPVFFRVFYKSFTNSSFCNDSTNFLSLGSPINEGNEVLITDLNDDFGYCFGIAVYDDNGNKNITTQWVD